MELWLSLPSPFVARHQRDILPDWQVDVASILVVLQRSRLPLRSSSDNSLQFSAIAESFLEFSPHAPEVPEAPDARSSREVEAEKDRLRSQFLTLAKLIAEQLQHRGFAADAIDPKSGYPILSRPGSMGHDDVAATVASLGFAVRPGDCTALVHSNWSTAVYPGILLSSASWGDFATVVREWGQSGSVF